MFAHISHIDDFSCVIQKEEIREQGLYHGENRVVSYMIAGNETFDSLESLEARGITFYSDGTLCARPLPKFFNMGEREETFEENLDPDDIIAVFDKLDGSLLHPYYHEDTNGQLKLDYKTKKSNESYLVKVARENANQEFDKICLANGCTPVYELVSPANRIVLKYEETKMVLLAIRDNYTGEFLKPDFVEALAQQCNIPVRDRFLDLEIKVFEEGFSSLKNYLRKQENMEGVVIQFSDGMMVKVKTPWYVEMHHAVSFSRPRDIARLILNEEIDDHKALLHEMGEDLAPVEEIENDVLHKLNHIRNEVEKEYDKHKNLDQKSFALKLKGHYLFSLIMKKYHGEEPNYLEWFKKNRLNDYSVDYTIF